MDELVADLERKAAEARLGGGAKASERMRSKGKKLPRERYVQCVLWLPVIDSRSLD
jgi:acetyl-CoA carboxylase carboxyltransferase component